MNLVITDGFTLNPGDLSWERLKSFGKTEYFDTTPPELAAERCADADIIISNKTIISAETIRSARHLKMIAVTATGYNNIDISAAKNTGVLVCNVPEYGTFSVAQHTFALILEMVNQVGLHVHSVRKGEWSGAGKWCYAKTPLTELRDKTLGIVGFGKIGQQTGVIAKAFGMKVIFSRRSRVHSAIGEQVSIERLFSESDVVSLHCPLTKENTGFVNSQLLSTMRSSALLINTSRGPLINETDLKEALENRILAGAALDVLSAEPPPADHPLVGLPNCYITPHNAWLSFEARQRMMEATWQNIRDFTAGNPQNIVNG